MHFLKHNHIIHQPLCIDQFGKLRDDLAVFLAPAANSSADVPTYSDLEGTCAMDSGAKLPHLVQYQRAGLPRSLRL